MARYLGIDFSGSAPAWAMRVSRPNVWIATLEDRTLVDLQPVQQLGGHGGPFDRLAALLGKGDFAAAAIDAPFSVPERHLPPGGHAALLDAVAALPCDGRPFPTGAALAALAESVAPLERAKPMRATERGWGVSTRSTLWNGPRGGAPFAAACLTLLARTRRPVWPWARGPGMLVEGFPAAQLRHWGLPHQGYNGPDGRPARDRIIAGLADRLTFDAAQAATMRDSADAMDAAIVAFGAIAAVEGRCVPADHGADDGRIAVYDDAAQPAMLPEERDMAARPVDTAPLDAISPEEQALRRELADFYHLVHFMGWSELCFNHISARVPGTDAYLVNPFGLHYTEVTPDNLLTVGVDGKLRRPSPHPANPAGFALHGAVHAARHDVGCIAHTHTTQVAAVCGKAHGFTHDNFYGAQLIGRIGYHDFEGITIYDGERERMVRSLGDKAVLCLRNHGVAVAERDIPTTFMLLWTVHRAAEVQAQAEAMRSADIVLPDTIKDSCRADAAKLNATASYARFAFDAQVRLMRRMQR